MPYIGNQPGTGVRSRFIYTATASQTTFSGADNNSKTLKYADSDYIDVYLNGVCLVPGTDYTASTKTSVVLVQAASVSDTLEVVAYDIATISDTVSKADGGTFNGDLGITNASPDITLTNNTTEDTDGGRESTVTFKGLQSGGEESTLAEIRASHDATADDQKGDLIFKTNDGSDGASPTEVMRIDSSGNVGIGTNDPAHTLTINSADEDHIRLENGSEIGFIKLMDDGDINIWAHGSENIKFLNGTGSGTERMRIDSSGVLLVGKTASDGGVAGHEMRPTSFAAHTISGGTALVARRLSDDGTIALFQYQGGDAGYIGTGNTGDLYIGNSTTGFMFAGGSNAIIPTNQTSLRDNAISLGLSNYRYDDAFITNGVTTGSDQNEKQQIASLTSAEMTAAKAISALFKTFKWNDAVESKGDAARTHTGVMAQEIETAMSDVGLDSGDYAFFMSDTWWEVERVVPAVEANEEEMIEAKEEHTIIDCYYTTDEAPEGATEKNRKGIRYPELLSFVSAATEQRLTSIETQNTTQATQIADLITRVAALEAG